jgi:hypothetical protein
VQSAKQIAAFIPFAEYRRKRFQRVIRQTTREQKRPIVLGFDAWHFQLSEGPILEEMTYG